MMTSKSKWVWVLVGALAGGMLASGLFLSGLTAGAVLTQAARAGLLPEQAVQWLPSVDQVSTYESAPPEGADALFRPFWQAWDIVHQEFVDQPVDDVAMMRGAIRGALDALGDPHTAYMDPETYVQANIPLQGSYEGIGAWVDTNAEYLTIVSPMPGSPAEKAGLQPGDEVVAVDGEDMTGIDANLVIRRVLGPAGTKVRLTIRREGEPDLFDVEIIRAEIDVPSIQSRVLDDELGYIQLFSFSGETAGDLRSAIRALKQQGMQALILDLRGNGGGFLHTAIDVASEFIPGGTVVIERFGDGSEQTYEANGKGMATDLPLVVLVDEGSASASEIVAGAIQDYERGLLIGETTFGKGSVQNWVPLDGDEGAVRVTVARWYTPSGRQIQDIGLEPDILVEVDPMSLDPGEDPQLAAAENALREILRGSSLEGS